MSSKMKILIAFLVLFLSGCSLPFSFSGPPKSYYKLSADLQYDKIYPSRPERIGVRDILASGFVDSHRILFSRISGEIGYYQFASWVDSPARSLSDSLELSLDRSRLFKSVSKTTSGAVTDYQLNGELIEFLHETSSPQSAVHIVFRSELIDLRTRQVIATKLFDLVQQVTQNDVSGAVFSFNLASRKLLSEIIAWVDESLPDLKDISSPPALSSTVPQSKVP